jgi:hypothetical protein
MSELNLAWAVWGAWALILVLCLPFSGTRKLLLELTGWVLRLAILTALAGGALLWFRPDLVPAEVVRVVDAFPLLRENLPPAGSPGYGLYAAVIVTAALLPLLAVFDVTRKLAGRRLRRLRRLADEAPAPVVTTVRPEPAVAVPVVSPPPAARRVDRRSAADAMAALGSRKPFRIADHPS